jgi:anhydro-N-acetylmuramic acid kinase
MRNYNVIGIMSGTSLDGVDIAFCHFCKIENDWHFKILYAETISYSIGWSEKLANLQNASAFEFAKTNTDYGHYLGEITSNFIKKHSLSVDFVSSHGHTIFHQPNLKLTSQIGDGAALATVCKLPVVCDFRSSDIALGGQGAPLVPIGDKLLFGEYDYCLNLGGIANISLDINNEYLAFDICPVNIVLNHLVKELNLNYDDNGDLARKGTIDYILLEKLNLLTFYELNPPKSLGKEWIDEHIFPLIKPSGLNTNDLLRTFCEHIAMQISHILKIFEDKEQKKILITGGGAFNTFLINCIKTQSPSNIEIIVPDAETVNFKEALIFAFLGVLRMRAEENCLKTVTGASRNSIGGAVYLG